MRSIAETPPLVSSVTGIEWPALPGTAGTLTLAVLGQLEDSQWWPEDRLRAMQSHQVGHLLDHAFRSVPYYRKRLRAAGFQEGRPVTPELWARIPLLTRRDLQQSRRDLDSQQLPKGHGPSHEITTSGSTGMPVTVLGTAVTRFFWTIFTVRDCLWHKRDVTASIASIRNVKSGGAAYPDGIERPDWGPTFKPLFATGTGALLNIATPVEQQIEWLTRRKAGYLVTFPSNLEALLDHSEAAGITLPGLLGIQTLAEVLPPRVREACRRVWNVPVADVYSSEELGNIALQCPDHEHHHVQAENVLVEVLDDAGRGCAPGQVGKVVVTQLHNFATPMIRYDIGDYAEVGGPCPCGRGLPVLKHIMGRVRNMLTLPSGERLWPSFGDTGYTDIAPIRQFQFVQKTPGDLEMRLVADRPLTASEEEQLKNLVDSRMGHPFALTLTYHDEIARSAGGKFEDFKSEIDSRGADAPS